MDIAIIMIHSLPKIPKRKELLNHQQVFYKNLKNNLTKKLV